MEGLLSFFGSSFFFRIFFLFSGLLLFFESSLFRIFFLILDLLLFVLPFIISRRLQRLHQFVGGHKIVVKLPAVMSGVVVVASFDVFFKMVP